MARGSVHLTSQRDARAERSHEGNRRSSYDVPQNFNYLTENAAPEPADEEKSSCEPYATDRFLEDQRGEPTRSSIQGRRASFAGPDVNLSEIATCAPAELAPTHASGFLEDRERGAPKPSSGPDSSSGSGLEVKDRYLLGDGTNIVSKLVTELYTVSYLIFFSILGTLARLGVQWLAFYHGAPIVTPVLWANAAGSFAMGFFVEDRRLFQNYIPEGQGESEIGKVKKTVPLYIGLATGFCGCFTSFSTFMRDAFLALANSLPTPVNHPQSGFNSMSSDNIGRNGGYSFEALLAVLLSTVALSLGGMMMGAHAALLVHPNMPGLPPKFTNAFVDNAMVVLGWGCWLGSVFLAIWPPDRPSGPVSRESWSHEAWRGQVLFALVFAPVGCLTRFYFSLWLNAKIASFPLGTFLVNITGTMLEGMLFDLQRVNLAPSNIVGGGRTLCQVFQGLQDGYCGSLTTVSTWVIEFHGLKRKHGYIYALTTIIIGLCSMIIIMGSVGWSIGWKNPMCNIGYPSKINS